jgi:nucleotide-binding universal stress UspA family protein
VRTDLEVGGAAPALLRHCGQSRLVVVGHRGLGGFTGLLLGSVGVALSAHAVCPVVVVRGEPPAQGPVVVGVDDSPHGPTVVRTAFEEAARRDATLVAVHAWTVELSTPDGAFEDFHQAAAHGERAGGQLLERVVGQVARDFPGVRTTLCLGDRSAAAELVEASRGAQLVVVGSRGVGGLRGLLLGSTAHAVIHHADCPVLVERVPADGTRSR